MHEENHIYHIIFCYYGLMKKLYDVENDFVRFISSWLILYFYFPGETTVSNEVLDTVLKAGEVLKIRGLWRQSEDSADGSAEKTAQAVATTTKAIMPKKDEIAIQPKLTVKKDDKFIKTFNTGQPGTRCVEIFNYCLLFHEMVVRMGWMWEHKGKSGKKSMYWCAM